MTVPEECVEKHLAELREAGMTGVHVAGAPMPRAPRAPVTSGELATALANLEWLVRNRDATFDPETLTVVCGDGGFYVDSLFNEDLTPAREEAAEAAQKALGLAEGSDETR
jgi:hypothetical protein